MLEGSVAEYLSHMQKKKPAHPTCWWVPCSTRERWFKNILSNWHSTYNLVVTNNITISFCETFVSH